MFCTVVPIFVSVSAETLSRVSFCALTDGPAAETVIGRHAGGDERALAPGADGNRETQDLGGYGGQRRIQIGVALRGGRREQPQPRRRRSGLGAPAVEPDAIDLALGDVSQGDDGVEVVGLVVLDEAPRAERPVCVAGGAQKDDAVFVRRDREGSRQLEQRRDPGGVVAGALRRQLRDIAVRDEHDRPLRAPLGDGPHVLQGYVLAVHLGRVALDVRLEAGLPELLLHPDPGAIVRVAARDSLGELLDDGLEIGGRGGPVERRWLRAELGGVWAAQCEEGDHDEDHRDDPGDSIHLEVGQGRPPWACRASYQMRSPRSGSPPRGVRV